MCLLKAYLEEDNVSRIIASEVAFIYAEDWGFRLKIIDRKEEVTLKNVSLSRVDALNSTITFSARETVKNRSR